MLRVLIYMYTSDEIVYESWLLPFWGKQFYAEFNSATCETSDLSKGRHTYRRLHVLYWSYLFLLMFHSRHLVWMKPNQRKYFRGGNFPADFLKEGYYLRFNHVISVSSSETVANGFFERAAQKATDVKGAPSCPTFFTITSPPDILQPARIDKYSAFPSECESLFFPEAQFKIKSVEKEMRKFEFIENEIQVQYVELEYAYDSYITETFWDILEENPSVNNTNDNTNDVEYCKILCQPNFFEEFPDKMHGWRDEHMVLEVMLGALSISSIITVVYSFFLDSRLNKIQF